MLTTLGLIVGLNAGSKSRSAVAAGIVTITLADAFSDALGLHVSQRSAGEDIEAAWVAAGATFVAKLVIALSFLIPVLLFSLTTAVVVSVLWGFALLTVLIWYVARRNDTPPATAVAMHLLVAIVVLATSQAAGVLVRETIGSD